MYKLNISEKGKTYKIEVELDSVEGKILGDKIKGSDIKPELEGYELEITGASDKAGFPYFKEVEGSQLKRILLSKGKGMSGWKKKRKKHIKIKGLRKKRTVRGNTISRDTSQINLAVRKAGKTKLEEVFPEQAQAREVKEKALKEKIANAKNPQTPVAPTPAQ